MFSPWPMLRVTGRLLGVGLATSNSLRSMGMGESQPRGREIAGDRLFSCCQWGKNKELIEFLWSPACLCLKGTGGPWPAQTRQSPLSRPGRSHATFPSYQEHLRSVQLDMCEGSPLIWGESCRGQGQKQQQPTSVGCCLQLETQHQNEPLSR